MQGFFALQELPLEQVTADYARRALVGDQEMVVWATMKAGAHAAAHRHPHEQMFWLLSGSMEFRLGDERRTCRPGSLVVVPGNVEHEVWFPEASEFVTMLSPVRDDLRPGAPPPPHLVADRTG